MAKGLKALGYIVAGSVFFGSLLGINAKLNQRWNNQTLSGKGYLNVSKSERIIGHTEYIKYDDGSQQVVIFPKTGLYGLKFFDDINGDNLVDRIRGNASVWKRNKLQKILIRSYDLETHKAEFEEADSTLQALSGIKGPQEEKPLIPIGEKSKLILN